MLTYESFKVLNTLLLAARYINKSFVLISLVDYMKNIKDIRVWHKKYFCTNRLIPKRKTWNISAWRAVCP